MKITDTKEIVLQITKKVFQGYGLADWQGYKVFVTGGVPGDKVLVKLTHRKKDVYFGRIIKVIEPSIARKSPPCNAFENCGGCDWLNINRSQQIKYKSEILQDFMGGFEIKKQFPLNYSDQQYHYRNKCFYPLRLHKGKPVFGMYARFTHEVVQHKSCFIQPEIFDKISQDVCEYIQNAKAEIYDEISGRGNIRYLGFRTNEDQSQIQVILVTARARLPFTKQLVRSLEKYPQISSIIHNINRSRGNAILGEKQKLLLGNEFLSISTAGKKFQVSYRAFYQVNIPVLEKMIAFCRDYISESSSLIDAYCGTGVLGISLLLPHQKLIGIDNSAQAVKNAAYNAKQNGVEQHEYICGDAARMIPQIVPAYSDASIIFDPPRKGLTPQIIDTVINNGIKRVIYISCNPATQVRDLKKFIAGGYQIIASQGFDMFPQTWHIENIVILQK